MKSAPIVIGKAADRAIAIDLPHLLETRMLVQSNSGGGKSWALRRLLEQTAPHAQQIIIDVEGEFTTLREKFDFVICAPQHGDAAATPHTAAVLARKLRELRVSAILDIHDLKASDRQAFVRKFFEALMQAPREDWNPALIVLDEAHLFAPEQGKGESTASVIDLATRGRKRGLALVAATQRLSKLHKDMAAELLNKMIGRTGLDVDVRRAGDELGMTARDAMASLRDLQPGEFFTFGPALTSKVTKLRIGTVQTTHPQVGDRLTIKTPAPSRKVLTILQALGDLPREAEAEEQTVAQLRAEIATLKSRPVKRPEVMEADVLKRVEQAVAAAQAEHFKTLRTLAGTIDQALGTQKQSAPIHLVPAAPAKPEVKKAASTTPDRNSAMSAPQQRILDAIAQLEALGLSDIHKIQVAAVAGVSPNSGSYAANLGRLREAGFLEYPQPALVAFSLQGRRQAKRVSTPPGLDDLHEAWFGIINGPQQKILREVIAAHPTTIAKDELAQQIGVSPDSGSYAANLGKLRSLGAIDYPRPGFVQATAVLFPKLADVA